MHHADFKIRFTQFDAETFSDLTSTEVKCLQLVADMKWANGYKCRKCGHTNFCSGVKPYSRRCTRCKHVESATAHTMFHGCRLPLPLAFQLARKICCDSEISSHELSRQTNIRQMTCWKLKQKVMKVGDELAKEPLLPS